MTISKQVSRIAVIGAGPSGLAAVKYGVPFLCGSGTLANNLPGIFLLRNVLIRLMSLRKGVLLVVSGITPRGP